MVILLKELTSIYIELPPPSVNCQLST